MAGSHGQSVCRSRKYFNSKELMETKTRKSRESKVKHIGLSVIYKSYLNAISKTESMDKPRGVTLLFNMAWEQASHRLINLQIIFNLRKLNKFNIFLQSLIACLRQKLFLHVSHLIWNSANLRSNSTFKGSLIWPITCRK